jgi:predicted HicB family RNase H-like nuclease
MAAAEPPRYTYRAEWSSRRGHYVGRCLELPRVETTAPTASEAISRLEAAVARYLIEMDEMFGGEAPTPLTEQDFSGTFLVRTSPELHARLSMEAAEQGVSVNKWVVQRLANRPPSLDW